MVIVSLSRSFLSGDPSLHDHYSFPHYYDQLRLPQALHTTLTVTIDVVLPTSFRKPLDLPSSVVYLYRLASACDSGG